MVTLASIPCIAIVTSSTILAVVSVCVLYAVADSSYIITNTALHIAVTITLAWLTSFRRRGISPAATYTLVACGSRRPMLTLVADSNTRGAHAVDVAAAVDRTVGFSPAQLAYALVLGPARTLAMHAIVDASEVAFRDAVASVALFTGTDERVLRIATGGIDVTIVSAKSTLINIRTLAVRPNCSGHI